MINEYVKLSGGGTPLCACGGVAKWRPAVKEEGIGGRLIWTIKRDGIGLFDNMDARYAIGS